MPRLKEMAEGTKVQMRLHFFIYERISSWEISHTTRKSGRVARLFEENQKSKKLNLTFITH